MNHYICAKQGCTKLVTRRGAFCWHHRSEEKR